MNSAIKIVVAMLVVALIAVVGLIIVTQNSAKEAADVAATQTEVKQPEETAAQETAEEPIPEGTDVEDIADTQSGADNEAQNAEESADEEAQGTMYEGALAGLTEEEIAVLALAEERHSSADMSEDDGQEGPID